MRQYLEKATRVSPSELFSSPFAKRASSAGDIERGGLFRFVLGDDWDVLTLLIYGEAED